MNHYVLLCSSSVLILALAIAVWLKTRQVSFLVGFGFLYYWSLYGAWLVIARGTGAGQNYRFEYMYHKLFPVYVDDYYLLTLALYTLFIVTVQVTILTVAKRPPPQDIPYRPLRLDHRVTLAVATILAAAAVFMVKDVLSTAAAMNVSPYAVVGAVQSGNDPTLRVPFFTLYQVLNETALGTLTLGVAVVMSGRHGIYIVSRQNVWPAFVYAVVLGAVLAFNLLMGNRSTMVFAILPSGFFYIANVKRVNKALLAGAGVAAMVAIVLPGILRSAGAVREISNRGILEQAFYVVTEALSQQTEAFATHASMYGTLSKHVSFTYGSSLLWLVGSAVPSVVRPELVPTIYAHYATSVGAAADQGFTIHQATGWYLNFGIPGLLMGAVLFGWVWARLFNGFHYRRPIAGHFQRVFFTIAAWNFAGFIPALVRGGPESYKGLIMEALLIPTLILAIGCSRMIIRHNRPCVLPADQSALA